MDEMLEFKTFEPDWWGETPSIKIDDKGCVWGWSSFDSECPIHDIEQEENNG